MDDIIHTLETIYETVGFNGLLGALDTVLLLRLDTLRRQRESLNIEATQNLIYEIARLQKARMLLSDTERADVRMRGILWMPMA